jgi:hypothetical protein
MGSRDAGSGVELLTVRIKMPLINVRQDLFGWYELQGHRAVGELVELPPVLQPMKF